METIVIAGGCFWCVEALFVRVRGVKSVESGYAGGTTTNPTYEQVCTGRTGHAESVRITFDPAVISTHDLLTLFFLLHDPTTLNRQGNDVGTPYRSAVFYASEEQKDVALQVMKEITEEKVWPSRLVTEVTPLDVFTVAEEYHQHYFEKNPDMAYCQYVIAPKVSKLRKRYEHLLVEEGSLAA